MQLDIYLNSNYESYTLLDKSETLFSGNKALIALERLIVAMVDLRYRKNTTGVADKFWSTSITETP